MTTFNARVSFKSASGVTPTQPSKENSKSDASISGDFANDSRDMVAISEEGDRCELSATIEEVTSAVDGVCFAPFELPVIPWLPLEQCP